MIREYLAKLGHAVRRVRHKHVRGGIVGVAVNRNRSAGEMDGGNGASVSTSVLK